MICRGKVPMLIANNKFQLWEEEAQWQLKSQNVSRDKLEFFDVEVWIYAPDRRRSDASNKFESIMDLLVDYEVIKDDSWWNVRSVIIHPVELDIKNPRAEILLTARE